MNSGGSSSTGSEQPIQALFAPSYPCDEDIYVGDDDTWYEGPDIGQWGIMAISSVIDALDSIPRPGVRGYALIDSGSAVTAGPWDFGSDLDTR